MRKATTVELDRKELEDAIHQYLYEKGYVAAKVEFRYQKLYSGDIKIAGAIVEVKSN